MTNGYRGYQVVSKPGFAAKCYYVILPGKWNGECLIQSGGNASFEQVKFFASGIQFHYYRYNRISFR